MIFSLKSTSKFNILETINKIIRENEIEDSALVISLIYIELLCKRGIVLTQYNLTIVSIMVSVKIIADDIYDNSEYAIITKIKLKLLNKLEREFLELMEYEMFVNKKDFEKHQAFLSSYLHKA